MPELSILIPARNEMFLSQTIENILENIEGDTEIIVVLDGQWPSPPVKDHERVVMIYLPEAIGQRASTNLACRMSNAKYVMKADAHCAFDKGFDVKMMAEMKDHYTMIPRMYNLHAFDWVCSCGHRLYQCPTPEKCEKCDGKMEREIIWKPRLSRKTDFMRFDNDLKFQYWGEYEKRPEAKGDVVPIMSFLGACFMMTREKYWELDICDENHGSWGQQGTEVSCKTWLSGGELVVNKKTWFSHMFRTQGGDFGFPYPISGGDVDRARNYSKHLWKGNNWPKAKHKLSWLVEKFAPIPGWSVDQIKALDEDIIPRKPKKGVAYYTDSRLDDRIAQEVRKNITRGIKEKHIVSVSLKSLNFGKNIVCYDEPGYLTMARQILTGLKTSDAEVIFFCEHDVLYHPSHFDFVPPDKTKIYYNTNVWRVRTTDGLAVRTEDCRQLSGLVAYRDILIEHYKKRIHQLEDKKIELDFESFNNDYDDGYKNVLFNRYVRQMGFEPGTHGREQRVDDLQSDRYESKFPNLDIRHGKNLTNSKWKPTDYRNAKFAQGFKELHVSQVPGWLEIKDFFNCL